MGAYGMEAAVSTVGPMDTLFCLHDAGMDVRRDTITTTDFRAADVAHLIEAVQTGSSVEGGFTLEMCYDADDRGSIEALCDNCRAPGHLRWQCPSPKKFRSFDYVITLLQRAKARAEHRGAQRGSPVGGKTPPPRGQRAPFRRFPRRFQPRSMPMPPPRAPPAGGKQPLQYGRTVHYGRTAFDDDDKSSVGDADEQHDTVQTVVETADAMQSASVLPAAPLIDSGATRSAAGEGAFVPAVEPKIDEPTSVEAAEAVTQPLFFNDDGYFSDEYAERANVLRFVNSGPIDGEPIIEQGDK
eukprot:6283784-Prymnesium_polylepis.1